MLNRRTLNSCSESYSLRISSVSTEQSRIGVINAGRENLRNQGIRRIMSKNINQGLMKSVEANEVHSFGIYSETDKGSRKRVQVKCENIR